MGRPAQELLSKLLSLEGKFCSTHHYVQGTHTVTSDDLFPLEAVVDNTWAKVLEQFHCGSPDGEYCGGCVKLMQAFEEAVRAHERAVVLYMQENIPKKKFNPVKYSWPPCHNLSNTGVLHPSAKPPCNGDSCVLCLKPRPEEPSGQLDLFS